MKNLNELQENSKRQFNEIWNKIHEQEEYLTRDLNSKKEPNRNYGAKEYNKWDKECVKKHFKKSRPYGKEN